MSSRDGKRATEEEVTLTEAERALLSSTSRAMTCPSSCLLSGHQPRQGLLRSRFLREGGTREHESSAAPELLKSPIEFLEKSGLRN